MFKNLNMDSQKKFLPKLYPVERNIKRTWYVAYTAKDGLRKKVYGKLNHLYTLQERLIEAESIIQSIITGDDILPANTIGNQLIKDLSVVFDLRKQDWKPKTLSAYQTHFETFARWFRANGCPAMDAMQAMLFLNTISAKNCATTRNNYRHNLKSLFSDLIRFFKNRYADNPFADIRKVKECRKTKEWFRPHHVTQLKKIISETDPNLWLAVQIMFHCFARPNELRQLKVADINFETSRLRIVSNVAKSSKIRFVPIPAALMPVLEILKYYPDDYYIFTKDNTPGERLIGRDTLSKRHEKIMRKLHYAKGFTFYSWKNTGAVKMLMMDKKPMRYVSKCMGHHSLDMTDKYFESLGVDEMAEAIIFPDLQKKSLVETKPRLPKLTDYE